MLRGTMSHLRDVDLLHCAQKQKFRHFVQQLGESPGSNHPLAVKADCERNGIDQSEFHYGRMIARL